MVRGAKAIPVGANRAFRRVGASAAVAVLISGCSFFETPYSLSLDDADEAGKERLAVITIGDPQVYARETLINDRRDEVIYLSEELKKPVKFTPQIARDLSTLMALRAALGVAVDPLAGERTGMQAQREELAQERDVVRLQQEIEYEKQKLDKLRAKTVEEASQSNQTAPSGTDRKADVTALIASIDAMKADLNTLLKAPRTARVSNLKDEFPVSPLDEFRDKQAYRAELRAALQAVNLDDLHDFGGNTLYRLQFQATLFPGENKAKFGAAQLTLEPPVLRRSEVNGLFYTWIGYAGLKMNRGSFNDYRYAQEDYYQTVGEQTGLFGTVCWQEKPNDTRQLCLPVPPGVELDQLTSDVAVPDGAEIRAEAAGCAALPTAALSRMRMIQMVDATLAKLDSNRVRRDFPTFLEKYKIAKASAVSARNSAPCRKAIDETFAAGAPLAFRKLLLREGGEECPSGRCELAGKAYAYATTPVELGQRVSTTASAARSFELALAASANLATSGVDVQGGLNLARSASGHVDAIERLPLTVGYSGRRPAADETLPDSQQFAKPEFGWVFGPAVRVDAANNRLRLVQVPRAETLTADLSVPAWWPSAKFRVQTAWIANWHAGRKVLSDGGPDSEDAILVTLPKKPADLELLTNKLMASLDFVSTMARKPVIEDVSPRRISACANEVTLVIKGTNIWRSTEVYLGGVKAADGDIKVLPDMEGVTAKFNLNLLFSSEAPETSDEAAAAAKKKADEAAAAAAAKKKADEAAAAAAAGKGGGTGTPTPPPSADQSGFFSFISSAFAAPAAAPPAAAPARTTTTPQNPTKKAKKKETPNVVAVPPVTVRSLDFETKPTDAADKNSERIELTVATRSGIDSVDYIKLTAESGATDCARRRLIAPASRF